METKFKIGEIVYLVTDMEQNPRLILDILYSVKNKKVIYLLACGTMYSEHVEAEIDREKTFH